MNNELTHQAVTAALKAAGFVAYYRSTRVKVNGYHVVQLSRTAVGVMSDSTDKPVERASKYQDVLVKAGFTITRPFPDATLLRVSR